MGQERPSTHTGMAEWVVDPVIWILAVENRGLHRRKYPHIPEVGANLRVGHIDGFGMKQ